MKYQLLLPIVPIWLWQAALTTAQSPDFSNIPSCAQAPAIQSIGKTNCDLTDYSCICTNAAFVDGLTSAIQKECTADEVQKVEKFANDLCASYGITVGAQASSTATSAAPSATGTGSRGTASTTAASTATSGTAASLTASASSTSTGAAMMARGGNSWEIGLLGALGAVVVGLW